jgi:hypothetical protein
MEPDRRDNKKKAVDILNIVRVETAETVSRKIN